MTLALFENAWLPCGLLECFIHASVRALRGRFTLSISMLESWLHRRFWIRRVCIGDETILKIV